MKTGLKVNNYISNKNLMKKYLSIITFLFLYIISFGGLFAQTNQKDTENVKVYFEKGMFGGWPANFGIWNWGNEILVGFAKGFHKDLGAERHNIDREKPELHLLARSLDGGETWEIEDPGKSGPGDLFVPNHGSYHGIERSDVKLQNLVECKGINFRHSDLAFTIRMTNVDGGESLFWYSYDRGHNWEGPVKLPEFNTLGTAARTDYIVDGKNECMLFLTAAKSNGKEGRVMCVKTTDGGKNWSFVSWIGHEPEEGYAIMPASVRLSEKEILVTIRRNTFIAAYMSIDNGLTWTGLANPVEDTGEGNPPAMVKMKDGRICLIYGIRKNPFSICAKISSDKGKTWSKAYTLRGDGSGRDIGYPRVIQRPDGKIVAIYYFQDEDTGHERYIGATIWSPPAAGTE